jgi:DNA helicase HerA-like ATPase
MAKGTAEGLAIAKGKALHELLPRLANRHRLIAGTTGTGKTATLRLIAEHFSAIGVPVFMADVKGDLSGIARPNVDNPKIAEPAAQIGVEATKPSGN